MSKRVSILLVGIGGYGKEYVDALLDNENEEKFQIIGVVDHRPGGSISRANIVERNIPVYTSIEEFYLTNTADLAIISSPIHFHSYQTCLALSRGSNVLCEKPLCATVEEAQKMIKARDASGKFVSVGYQWSFNDAILSLKRDILDGAFGKPKRLKTLAFFPKSLEYYNRSWAGRKFDDKGNYIMDSVANNATAHYIHNMFFILGHKTDSSACPASVKAELYRANTIENFDTAVFRSFTEDNVEIMYYGTHAVNKRLGPIFHYEFENAVVKYKFNNGPGEKEIVAIFSNGQEKKYGDPFASWQNKIWISINAIREGCPIPCTIETALSHTLCINGIHESVPEIQQFPSDLVKIDNNKEKNTKTVFVDGLYEALEYCYKLWKMPHEIGVHWAQAGKLVYLK